jgi:hypothetical protein
MAVGAAVVAFEGLAAAPPGRYVLTAETVADTQSGLTWQRAVPDASYSWADAKTYCEGLSLASQTGWRLPTVKELQTLVDIAAANLSIDAKAFPSTPASNFWSSSPYASNASAAWAVYFYDGSTYASATTSADRVRCVR